MSYVLCLHRWVYDAAAYDTYERPPGTALRFVCSEESASAVASVADSTEVVPDMDDSVAVTTAARRVTARFGVPDRVVGLNEGELLVAAQLRERFNVPGDRPRDIRRFRDKIDMAAAVAGQSAVTVPRTRGLDSPEDAEKLAGDVGYPVVVKPRLGTASRGVQIIDDPGQLAGLDPSREPLLVQEYRRAPVVHVDGWWDGTGLVIAEASDYVNSCSSFPELGVLGSHEITPGARRSRLLRAADAVLRAMAPGYSTVFHMELFDEDTAESFLEVAARVGGAEVPYIWREVHEVDLLGIAWELQTGYGGEFRKRARKAAGGHPRLGGWLLALRGWKENNLPASAYWSQREQGPTARGVYEGASVRVRFAAEDPEVLRADVGDTARLIEHSVQEVRGA